MIKQFLLFSLTFVFVQILHAQTFDTTIYSHLVAADSNAFITYAKSFGLNTAYDKASKTLFAKTKGWVYTKPLDGKSNNRYCDLVLIISTLNKEDKKLILKNATEYPD